MDTVPTGAIIILCGAGSVLATMAAVMSYDEQVRKYEATSACKDHGGVLALSADEQVVCCNDGTFWHWQQGYTIGVPP